MNTVVPKYVILDNEKQFSNAFVPIDFIFFHKLIFVNEVQLPNAYEPIESNDSGNFMFF